MIFSHVLYQLSYLGAEPAGRRATAERGGYRGTIAGCPQWRRRNRGSRRLVVRFWGLGFVGFGLHDRDHIDA